MLEHLQNALFALEAVAILRPSPEVAQYAAQLREFVARLEREDAVGEVTTQSLITRFSGVPQNAPVYVGTETSAGLVRVTSVKVFDELGSPFGVVTIPLAEIHTLAQR